MAGINEIAKTTVLMNGKQADDEIKKLSKSADDFAKKKREAFEKNDHAAYKKWDGELKNVNKQIKNMRLETQSVESVLKNLNGASLDEIQKAANKATRELRKMSQTDPGFKEKSAQAKILNERYRTMSSEMRGVQASGKGMFAGMADGFNKYFGMVTAIAASLTGVVLGFRQAITTFNDFEERVSNLSALTGLLGEELEWLSDKAKETSVGMTENGVRIKQSATDIVDAYTLIGSQRPELLKNKEALHEVTIAAITLSEAGKMKLEPAAMALTNTLNQMNLASSQSGRVINVISAGSQVGAGNIEYISQAMEKAGTSASLLNIPLEQVIGLIETAAPKFNEARMAGNSLDKVLLKMREGGIGYKDGVFDMNRALDELRERMANGESAGKMFGVEHAKMIEVLVQGQGEFNRYTTAVTGTNKAFEQAVTNTSNNAAKLAQAKNDLQLRMIKFGEMVAPSFTFSTNMVNKLIKLLMQLIDFTDKHGRSMIVAAATIAAYTIAVNASTIAFKAHYYWLLLVDKAQKLLNTSVKMNPYAAFIALGAGLITFLITLAKRTNEAAEAQKKYNEYLAETETLINNTKTIEERAATMDKMSKEQLERFKNDATEELKRFEELEDKKLLAAQAYQKQVELLEKYISSNAANEEEKRAMYSNKYVTQARDEAFVKFQEISNLIQTNRAKLTGFIADADTALNAAGGGGGGGGSKSEVDNIADYAEKNQKAFDEFKARAEQRLRLLGLINTEIENVMSVIDRMPNEEAIPDVSIDDLMNIQKTNLKKQYADGLIDQATYHNILEAMEAAHIMTMIELRKKTGQDTTDLENQLLDIKIKNNETEAASKIAFNKQVEDAAMQAAQDVSDTIFAIHADRIQAELDLQLTALDRQREAELKNKNLTDAQKDAIDEKYRKKSAAIKLATWKKEQNAAIIQAGINGALAITKTFAAYGFTPAAWVAAGAQALATGLQVGYIASQKPPQFKMGGYTASSLSDNTKAGIVHANEFVANADAVKNPDVKPVLDIIDEAQKDGSIKNLDISKKIKSDKTDILQKKENSYFNINLVDYAQKNGTISNLNLPQAITASSSFASQKSYSGASSRDKYEIDATMMLVAMNKFEQLITKLTDEGVKANLIYQDYKKMADKETTAIKRTI
jgi:hypothetical protein